MDYTTELKINFEKINYKLMGTHNENIIFEFDKKHIDSEIKIINTNSLFITVMCNKEHIEKLNIYSAVMRYNRIQTILSDGEIFCRVCNEEKRRQKLLEYYMNLCEELDFHFTKWAFGSTFKNKKKRFWIQKFFKIDFLKKCHYQQKCNDNQN